MYLHFELRSQGCKWSMLCFWLLATTSRWFISYVISGGVYIQSLGESDRSERSKTLELNIENKPSLLGLPFRQLCLTTRRHRSELKYKLYNRGPLLYNIRLLCSLFRIFSKLQLSPKLRHNEQIWLVLSLKQTGSGGNSSIAHVQVTPCALNNFAKLNVCHSTFGICFQEDLNIRGGDVSFLVLVSAHSCPAVSFVFFYDVQELAFRHGDGAFIVTLKRQSKDIFLLKKTGRDQLMSGGKPFKTWNLQTGTRLCRFR